jgi:hypothetical protein
MKRVLLAFGWVLISILAWKLADQYIFCPVYEFKEPQVFTGDSVYNPYVNFNSSNYYRANFHSHSNFGLGVTNGKGVSKDIWTTYDKLGYTFHSISQYQYIDHYNDSNSSFISAYEHGYNIKKSHQLVLGATSVEWKDYIFPQTLNNKQELLSRLAKDTGNVIILNHPDLRTGYEKQDLKYLHYYDCMEVLNPSAISISHWDTALSSGNRVFVVANDDVHDIFNENQVGRFCTLVSAPNKFSREALNSLKKGTCIAMWVPYSQGETLEKKKRKFDESRIALKNLAVQNDSMEVVFSEVVKNVEVYGQNGIKVFSDSNIQKLKIAFTKSSTYFRTEYTTSDGIKYFLNPIIRYKRNFESRKSIAEAFVKKVNRNNMAGLIFILVWSNFQLIVILKLLKVKSKSFFSRLLNKRVNV